MVVLPFFWETSSLVADVLDSSFVPPELLSGELFFSSNSSITTSLPSLVAVGCEFLLTDFASKDFIVAVNCASPLLLSGGVGDSAMLAVPGSVFGVALDAAFPYASFALDSDGSSSVVVFKLVDPTASRELTAVSVAVLEPARVSGILSTVASSFTDGAGEGVTAAVLLGDTLFVGVGSVLVVVLLLDVGSSSEHTEVFNCCRLVDIMVLLL